MNRAFLLVLSCLLLPWFSACSRSGGGAGNASGGTILDFTPAPLSVVGGELVAVTIATPILNPGAEYPVTWKLAGNQVAQSVARAASAGTLAMLVPLVPAGSYVADVQLSAAIGRVRFDLTAANPVADPVAYVDAVATQLAANAATLRGQANAEPDPVRRAARLADLDRIDARLQDLQVARQSASPADLLLLSAVLDATPLLRGGATLPAALAGGFNEEGRLAAIAADMVGSRFAVVGGLAAVTIGLTASLPLVVSAALVVGGLLAVASALPLTNDAVQRAFKPVDDFILQIGNPAGGGVTQPVMLNGVLAQPALSVVAETPLLLRGDADFGSLTTADRSSANASIQAIFADLDTIQSTFASLAPAAAALVSSAPPTEPEQPVVERSAVERSRISIESQSNPQVVLTLAVGELTATLQGATAPATTTAVFRYDAGEFGSLTQTVTIEVIDLLPNMVPIAAGTFSMGSPVTPLSVAPYFNQSAAQPVHHVTISRPFWMGAYEVTQAEYQAVMGSNPSVFQGANRPVETVTWNQAVAYCDALTVQEAAAGRLPSGYEYRLPTEAEWEYCCRAGTTTEFHYGPTLLCGQAKFGYSYHSLSPCSSSGTVDVGGYVPNAWGLYDMHGNVWEWCLDGWDGSANYPAGPVTDPYVPSSSGPYRVVRGGSWHFYSGLCRSAYRVGYFPSFSLNFVGFRVVCAPVLP